MLNNKYKDTDIAFYIEVFYHEGETHGNTSIPVYYGEIQDEIKAGFTIQEIKQMYEIR